MVERKDFQVTDEGRRKRRSVEGMKAKEKETRSLNTCLLHGEVKKQHGHMETGTFSGEEVCV